MTRVPWFQVLPTCLCCCPAHPNTKCLNTWCKCVRYIEDIHPYPIGEILAT